MKRLLLPLLLTVTLPLFAFTCLWAPWRSAYRGDQSKKCAFCYDAKIAQPHEAYIIKRNEKILAQLNPNPYAPGALLISPIKHADNVHDIPHEVLHEMWDTALELMEVYQDIFNVDSFNVGMNIGPHSGASKPEHIHLHVVPRIKKQDGWMEVTADTRVMQIHLGAIYSRLMEFV